MVTDYYSICLHLQCSLLLYMDKIMQQILGKLLPFFPELYMLNMVLEKVRTKRSDNGSQISSPGLTFFRMESLVSKYDSMITQFHATLCHNSA